MSETLDVRYVAKLARLALTDEEVATYGAQLGELLQHVDVLRQLPTDDVDATAQVIAARNVDRADEPRPSLDRDTVLAGAPARQGGYFRVPRILSEEP